MVFLFPSLHRSIFRCPQHSLQVLVRICLGCGSKVVNRGIRISVPLTWSGDSPRNFLGKAEKCLASTQLQRREPPILLFMVVILKLKAGLQRNIEKPSPFACFVNRGITEFHSTV